MRNKAGKGVVSEFHIKEIASNKMIKSAKILWDIGDNVITKPESSKICAGEKGR